MTARRRTLVQAALFGLRGGLSGKVVAGAGYTFAGTAARTVITLASVATLARLLNPHDFGLVAMATVITELAALFSNFGFGALLIQKRTITRLELDSVFWTSLFVGVLLAVIVFLASTACAAFFAEPMAADLLRALCWVFIFEELTVVPQALLSRLMRFATQFYIQLGMVLVRACLAVAAAMLGFGVWSLVFGSLGGGVVQAAAYLVAARYVPRLRFNSSFVSGRIGVSGSYFGSGLLFYINSNADLLLIGRLLGADALGYYQNARSLTDEIRSRIAIPLQRVLFPAFSAMQGDDVRLHAGILRSGKLLALVIAPVGFGIAATANELVEVLYGAKWMEMVVPLQLVSVSASIRAACSIASPVFNATNKVGLSFRIGVVATLFSIVSILVGSRWGLVGVSSGVVVASSFAIVGYLYALWCVGMTRAALGAILFGPFLASATMWACLQLARYAALPASMAVPLRLIALMGLGVMIYVVVCCAIARSHVREVWAVARTVRGGPDRSPSS